MIETPDDTSVSLHLTEVTWFTYHGYIIYKNEDSGYWYIRGHEGPSFASQSGAMQTIDGERRILWEEICQIEAERSR